METWTVYMLHCSDGKIYVGCTNDIDDRMIRHNGGEVLATRTKLPVKLLLTITFYNKYKAYAFEKYLKSGSGRAFVQRHFI